MLTKFQSVILKRTDHVGDLRVDGRIILKLIVEKTTFNGIE
jgi:hypothetical protein